LDGFGSIWLNLDSAWVLLGMFSRFWLSALATA
jgi:hypothetical protein